jgi:hypothetical protein
VHHRRVGGAPVVVGHYPDRPKLVADGVTPASCCLVEVLRQELFDQLGKRIVLNALLFGLVYLHLVPVAIYRVVGTALFRRLAAARKSAVGYATAKRQQSATGS